MIRCYGKPAQNAGGGRWRIGGKQRTLSTFIESSILRRNPYAETQNRYS